jgi:hypothetical protein
VPCAPSFRIWDRRICFGYPPARGRFCSVDRRFACIVPAERFHNNLPPRLVVSWQGFASQSGRKAREAAESRQPAADQPWTSDPSSRISSDHFQPPIAAVRPLRGTTNAALEVHPSPRWATICGVRRSIAAVLKPNPERPSPARPPRRSRSAAVNRAVADQSSASHRPVAQARQSTVASSPWRGQRSGPLGVIPRSKCGGPPLTAGPGGGAGHSVPGCLHSRGARAPFRNVTPGVRAFHHTLADPSGMMPEGSRSRTPAGVPGSRPPPAESSFSGWVRSPRSRMVCGARVTERRQVLIGVWWLVVRKGNAAIFGR